MPSNISQIFWSLLQSFLNFFPNLLSSFFILLLGILVSGWAKTIIVKSLKFIKLESFTKDKKIKKFLAKAELTQKLEEVIGSTVKWVILLAFFITSLNVLGLTTISDLLYRLLAYIPNIISAVVVLALGVLLAGALESFVKGALASVDLQTSRLMGKITSYITITLTFLVAISELNIAQNFINILFIGLVSTLSLGFGLALGLGGKDLVAKMLQDWYRQFRRDLKR